MAFLDTSGLIPSSAIGPTWQPKRSTGSYTGGMPNYTPPVGGYTSGAPSDLGALTAAINAMNLSAQTQANISRIPQEEALEAASSSNIAQQLSGEVPTDVINLIGQQAAERGISGANTNAAYLKALGLTSLGQQQRGQQELSAATARNPVAPLFDPTSQLLTPYQAGQLNLQQEQMTQQGELERARIQEQMQEAALRSGGGGYGGGGGGGTYVPPSAVDYGTEPGTIGPVGATSTATYGYGPYEYTGDYPTYTGSANAGGYDPVSGEYIPPDQWAAYNTLAT